jgi:peptidoglycan/xylan/chitin deacetylase (PgdA/CDA1 family)
MRAGGMLFGGHTHSHRRLSTLSPAEQRDELGRSLALLKDHVPDQPLWPFCYPFGKANSFDAHTVALLRELGYVCSFMTVPGEILPGTDLFGLPRIDPKECLDVAAARRPAQVR